MANELLNKVHLVQEALMLLRHGSQATLPPAELAAPGIHFRLNDPVNLRIAQPYNPGSPLNSMFIQSRVVLLNRFERAWLPITSQDLTRTLDQFSDRFLRFPMQVMAECLARAPHLVIAELELPMALEWAERVTDRQNGYSLRLLRAYDLQRDVLETMIDILYGTY